MNKKIIIAVSLTALALYFLLQKKSPEQQIKQQLSLVEKAINSHTPSTNPIEAIKVARDFSEFTTVDLVVQHQTQDMKYDFLSNQKELTYSLTMAQRMYESIKFKWLEINVSILSEMEAQAEAVAEIEIIRSSDAKSIKDVVPVKLYFSKLDDKWKISKAYNIDPFE